MARRPAQPHRGTTPRREVGQAPVTSAQELRPRHAGLDRVLRPVPTGSSVHDRKQSVDVRAAVRGVYGLDILPEQVHRRGRPRRQVSRKIHERATERGRGEISCQFRYNVGYRFPVMTGNTLCSQLEIVARTEPDRIAIETWRELRNPLERVLKMLSYSSQALDHDPNHANPNHRLTVE